MLRRSGTLDDMPYKSHYKAEGQTRAGPCLLCQALTKGPVFTVHLGFGEYVQLCRIHASKEFRESRGGRDFAHSLSAACKAYGNISKNRRKALNRIFAQLNAPRSDAAKELAKPQSYQLKKTRKAVEHACSKGVVSIKQLMQVAVEQLGKMALRNVAAPSKRTVRRWRQERRWALPGWQPPLVARRS